MTFGPVKVWHLLPSLSGGLHRAVHPALPARRLFAVSAALHPATQTVPKVQDRTSGRLQAHRFSNHRVSFCFQQLAENMSCAGFALAGSEK